MNKLYDQKLAVVNRLIATNDPVAVAEAAKLLACGTQFNVWHSDLDGFSLKPVLCRSRLCPVCERVRAHKVSLKLSSLISDMALPKLLTLTIKPRPGDTVKSMCKRLTASFSCLRRQKLFKRWVSGAWVIEVKYSEGRAVPHCHIHAVLDGPVIPQKLISDAWLSITGDSSIVDIRQVRSGPGTVRYLSKYLGKGDIPDDSSLLSFFEQSKGLRFYGTWGKARTKSSVLPGLDTQPVVVCTLHSLIRKADAGDIQSMGILWCLIDKYSKVRESCDGSSLCTPSAFPTTVGPGST